MIKIQKEIKLLSDLKRAKNLAWFFKTGKGEYGYGDKFIGLTMPQIRQLAKKYKFLSTPEIEKLVCSSIHEERMLALIIMTLRYPYEKDKFYKLYIKNRKYINNWDLVDVTCPRIVGDYLSNKPRDVLFKFANSKNLWERRISIIATAYFIQKNDFFDTLKIAEILLGDKHDLIHKAVGWMLREVGKRNKKIEEKFLQKHCKNMPRTMLRYAIEKFPDKERKKYLSAKFI
jgi:3-methyladenine DNA glycosylase AlkD